MKANYKEERQPRASSARTVQRNQCALRLVLTVHGQDGGHAVDDGVARSNGFGHHQLAGGVLAQPRPAAAKGGVARGRELLLELVQAAEVLGNRVGQLASWRAAALGLHALPVESVVPRLKKRACTYTRPQLSGYLQNS